MCAARERNGEGFDYTTCPVCNQQINGSPEELNDHVECCLNTVEVYCRYISSIILLHQACSCGLVECTLSLNGNKLGLCSVLGSQDSLCLGLLACMLWGNFLQEQNSLTLSSIVCEAWWYLNIAWHLNTIIIGWVHVGIEDELCTVGH